MKIYMSLAFKDNADRIEKNVVDDYSVHLEDYESINDLIARSIRTRTKFTPETDKNAVYDDFLDEEYWSNENIDRLPPDNNGETSSSSTGEQSEPGVDLEVSPVEPAAIP